MYKEGDVPRTSHNYEQNICHPMRSHPVQHLSHSLLQCDAAHLARLPMYTVMPLRKPFRTALSTSHRAPSGSASESCFRFVLRGRNSITPAPPPACTHTSLMCHEPAAQDSGCWDAGFETSTFASYPACQQRLYELGRFRSLHLGLRRCQQSLQHCVSPTCWHAPSQEGHRMGSDRVVQGGGERARQLHAAEHNSLQPAAAFSGAVCTCSLTLRVLCFMMLLGQRMRRAFR